MNDEMVIIGRKVDKLSDEISGLKGWIRGLMVTLPIIFVVLGHTYLSDIKNINDRIDNLKQKSYAIIHNNISLAKK